MNRLFDRVRRGRKGRVRQRIIGEDIDPRAPAPASKHQGKDTGIQKPAGRDAGAQGRHVKNHGEH